MGLLVLWLSCTVSLLIVSKLKLGLEVDDIASALVAAIAIGIANVLVRPVLTLLTLPITLVTLGLFLLVVNGLSLMFASSLVSGFRTKGLGGAIVGSVALSLVNLIVSRFMLRILG